MTPDSDGESISRAVAQGVESADHLTQPLERAIALGELIELLQGLVAGVAERRDAAITDVLDGRPAPSHRELAQRLGLSAQRVDQLAKLARDGRVKPSGGGSTA